MDCSKWIHKRCSGYKGVLREGLLHKCPRCDGQIPNSVGVFGGCRSEVDYVLVRRGERKFVRDVTVVGKELCIPQHKLVVCVAEILEKLKKKKEKCASRCKIWNTEGGTCLFQYVRNLLLR